MDKARIQQRFKKSLLTYNTHAKVQAQMAECLIELLIKTTGHTYNRILEIGCGPGLLTRKLMQHFRGARLFANDLVDDFQDHIHQTISPNIQFIPGDAETISGFPGQLDLVVSNAAFQWMISLETLLKKLEPLLMPKGIIAFSSFGPGHFPEIARLLGPGLTYPDPENMPALCGSAFDILFRRSESIVLYFPNGLAMLRHLKSTGVNSLYQTAWSKSALLAFAADYERRYKCPQGVSLTYHPFYCLLRKK
jgi:malonyl-ACP O-methyltransferase BioC